MASTYLTRTPGSAGDRKKWTLSGWYKRSANAADYLLSSGQYSSTQLSQILFEGDDKFNIAFYSAAAALEGHLETTRLFRDPAAWYHIVVACDTTQAGSSDRLKLYVNGVQQTTFVTETYPAQDYDTSINNNVAQNIGRREGSGFFNGVMAHVHFTDGTAYAASDFGETDSTSGIWVAKTSPSVTYGTNGYFLKFQDTAAFGDDSSGNNNDFAVSGTMTQTQDTPDNNFCTMNALEKNTNNTQTFSNGDNTVEITAGYGPVGSTMAVSKGKWYAECHIDSTASSGDLNIMLGINGSYNNPGNNTLGYSASAYGFYLYNGYMLTNNTSNSNTGGTQYWTSPGGGIVDDNKYWALALDCDNNKLYVRLDGTWLESADPSAGTGGYSITAPASTDWGCYRFANGIYFGNTNTFKWNFGNGFFGTTSAGATNADSDGYGVFKYSVPTGFKALCTAQLATYG